MNTIFQIPGNDGENNCIGNESPSNDVESKFINATAELVCDLLNVGYNDKRIVKSLLVNGLKDKLDSGRHEGLLQQYEAYVLEKSSERLRSTFKIPADVKINHNNASHAKFADIANWIKSNTEPILSISSEEEKFEKSESELGHLKK